MNIRNKRSQLWMIAYAIVALSIAFVIFHLAAFDWAGATLPASAPANPPPPTSAQVRAPSPASAPAGAALSPSIHDQRSDIIAAWTGATTFLALAAAILAALFNKKQLDTLEQQLRSSSEPLLAIVRVNSVELSGGEKVPQITVDFEIQNIGKAFASQPFMQVMLGDHVTDWSPLEWIPPSDTPINQVLKFPFSSKSHDAAFIKFAKKFSESLFDASPDLSKLLKLETSVTFTCRYTSPASTEAFFSSARLQHAEMWTKRYHYRNNDQELR